jgi:hypothetical protein
MNWETLSLDLTARPNAEAPSDGGGRDGRGGGPAISALAFSPKDAKTFWAGTSNGLIQLSRDGGKEWSNVTPPAVQNATISAVEAAAAMPRALSRLWAAGAAAADSRRPRAARRAFFAPTTSARTGRR